MLIKTKYHESSREEMLRFILNKPKVSLEVGCRGAHHSKLIKQKLDIKETWGIEPDDNSTIVNEAQENLDYFINDFLTSKTEGLPKKHFDLIVFNDVLEHIYDPWEILSFSKQLLTKDGIIVISLPNIRHKSILKELILNDNFEYAEEGLLDVSHIRFFTKKTIIKMFEDLGYEIIKFEPLAIERPKIRRKIFDFLTNERFKTMRVFQFGITVKVKS